MSQNSSQSTTDHDAIKQWAETRNGQPARVKSTSDADDTGLIRLTFSKPDDDSNLETISWDEWFEAFEANKLELVYQEENSNGERSQFNKLVSRH